ncbi:HD-GYP domain-containing protein [Candidatus Aerophobetes bacterium]|nr:HD-GYP domain-containing protein [Candidatus Aerophobetes bacterium]
MKFKRNELSLYIYLVTVVGLALLIIWTVNIDISWETGKAFLFWATLVFIAELFSVSLPYGGSVTLAFPIIYATLITQGPVMGVWVVSCGALTELKKGKNADVKKILFNCGQFTISVSGAWLAYKYTGGMVIRSPDAAHIVPLICAATSYFVLNSFIVSTVVALEKKSSVFDMWSNNFRWAMPNYLAQTPLGFLMAMVYYQISWWAVTFIMFPLFVVYWAYKLYMDMRKEHLSVIQALATAVEARDPYTEKHSQRMANYATETARELGCSIYNAEVIRYAAILHDIGKIGVSDTILSKDDSFSKEDWNKIRRHSTIGGEILSQVGGSFTEVSRIVYHHHERYNGSGYPAKIQGESIPLGSRIIAVVDAYDAMTSHRPYREALSKEKAIKELKKHAGTQFDGKVVEAFLKVLKRDAT